MVVWCRMCVVVGESSPLSHVSLATLRRGVGPLVLSCVCKLRQAKGKEEDKQEAAGATMQALALLVRLPATLMQRKTSLRSRDICIWLPL